MVEKSGDDLIFKWTLQDGAIGYKIYSDNGSGGVIDTLEYTIEGQSTLTYTATNWYIGKSMGKQYKFALAAYNSAGNAPLGTSKEVSIPPASPTTFSVAKSGTIDLEFTWAAVSGATGYKIYTDNGGGGTITTASTEVTIGATTGATTTAKATGWYTGKTVGVVYYKERVRYFV